MKIFHHIGRWLGLGAALCGIAHAGEFAVLNNGFRLHAERHEVVGDKVRLFANGGFTDVAALEVALFELEPVRPVAEVPKPAILAAPPPQPVRGDMFEETARKHGIPVALVRSIVKAESNFRTDALSPKGAVGLMQLMPGTAKQLGADPRVPEQNVDAGTRYLRELLARYEDKDDQVARAIAAYNAGPGAVDKYKGVPPYRETQEYVRRVLKTYDKLKID